MIINDSDGYPVNTIEMADIAKNYGTPMYQGKSCIYSHSAS